MRHIRGFNRERNDMFNSTTVPLRSMSSMQSPSRGMATPSREPSLNGERAIPSREAFPGRVSPSYPPKEAGFTRWDPRKDAPEYDPVLPRAKAVENQKNTPLTLDIFIKNVMRKEPAAGDDKEKEPIQEGLVNEEKIIAETAKEVIKSD